MQGKGFKGHKEIAQSSKMIFLRVKKPTMSKPTSRFFALTAMLLVILAALIGCAPQATVTPESTNFTQFTPSPTLDFIPVIPKNAEEIIIFSFEEDGYAHLFAYIPGKLQLTRITSGNWDDIDPVPSPDGETIAFASNRNGFWDLYRLNLSTGEITQLTDTEEYEGSPTFSPDGSFIAFESYTN